MSKDSHYSYLVNPKAPVSSLFATPLLPAENAEQNANTMEVYRISRLYPGLWSTKLLGGSFNTIGNVTTVMDNDVYYMKFNAENFTQQYSSEYLVNYLFHESFHYFMQNDWTGGERFAGELDETGHAGAFFVKGPSHPPNGDKI